MSIDHPFTGYALNAVDAKGRVSVPAAFRELIATRCLVYAAGDASVKDNVLQIGMNEDMDRLQAFDAIAQRQVSRDLRDSVADLPAAERRKAVAELGSGELGATVQVTFDPAGRMVIPPMLREFAGIGDFALFWGTVDYFEIWDPVAAREAFADNPRKRKTVDYLLRERGDRGMTAARAHEPVLLDAVMAGLAPRAGETMIDGTFGAGGYTRALLGAGVRVIAFDRDPDAIAEGQALVADSGGALTLVHDVYSRMAQAVDGAVDGVTLDVGVSSMQLDRAERGFSFQADGPLDMRMGQSGTSAAEFVNEADEAEIADVLFHLGEERQSRRVARAIVAARPITRTGELAAIVRRALGHREHDRKDPATRTFQAIRIHVNRELGELEDGLAAAERVLAPGGRLAVVSFHSLEDRIVKRFLKDRSGTAAGSRHRPDLSADAPPPSFEAVARAVRADDAEVARNPRARSATLRVARRTAATPRSMKKGQPS